MNHLTQLDNETFFPFNDLSDDPVGGMGSEECDSEYGRNAGKPDLCCRACNDYQSEGFWSSEW